MKDAPISLTLDLWSLGSSATDIVRKLGFPNRRHVERIIAAARAAGDPRAVYHQSGGRIMGTGIKPSRRRAKRVHQGVQIVERIGKTVCSHGHLRTPYSVDEHHRCIQCRRLRP